MKTTVTLPVGYGERFSIDLQRDKKLMLIVNGIGLVIAVVVAVVGHLLVPLQTMFDLSRGLVPYAIRFGVMILGAVVYIVLHEAVHGIVMYRFSGVRPKFGFTGVYAYAGSTVYFSKKHYIIIALAPVVLWGVVLGVLSLLVPQGWFWVVWFIQLTNLSGAGGDIYVTWRFSKLPRDILVQDTGVAMSVFGREE